MIKKIYLSKLAVILTALSLWACSATERNTETNEQVNSRYGTFLNYTESLPNLQLPIILQSDSEDFPLPPENLDSVAYQRFKHAYGLQPAGIVYKTQEYLAIMEYSGGDLGLIPLLTTYSPEGNKIDSLAPYSVSGTDIGYEATETVSFLPNKSIQVVATIKRTAQNEAEEAELGSKEVIRQDTAEYILQPNGKFTIGQ
jgi:hypothetical protein